MTATQILDENPPEEEEPWTEQRMLSALESSDRFGPPNAAFLAHVHGYVGGVRSADGVSIGVRESRGLMIQGIEVKTTRSDWLRELHKPEKADGTVFRFCDRWWLAVPRGKKVIQPGELPAPWGIVSIDGRGVHVEKQAPELSPVPIDRRFVSELFRRAVEQLPEERVIRTARDRGYAEGRKDEMENAAERAKGLETELAEKRELIASFEKVLGQSIDRWSSDDRGEKVRRALEFVLENGHESAIRELERARKVVVSLLEDMDKSLTEARGEVDAGRKVLA